MGRARTLGQVLRRDTVDLPAFTKGIDKLGLTQSIRVRCSAMVSMANDLEFKALTTPIENESDAKLWVLSNLITQCNTMILGIERLVYLAGKGME